MLLIVNVININNAYHYFIIKKKIPNETKLYITIKNKIDM